MRIVETEAQLSALCSAKLSGRLSTSARLPSSSAM
jgi:hypothetical protein